MKKIMLVLCFTLICLTTFSACASNKPDGFIEVSQIEYTIMGGESKTEVSKINFEWPSSLGISSFIANNTTSFEVTKDEYDAASWGTYVYPSFYFFPSSENLDIDRTSNNSKFEIGKFYYAQYGYFDSRPTRYFKAKLLNTTYSYISVKVVDTSTIIVKNNSGETTITVSSYKITHFTD